MAGVDAAAHAIRGAVAGGGGGADAAMPLALAGVGGAGVGDGAAANVFAAVGALGAAHTNEVEQLEAQQRALHQQNKRLAREIKTKKQRDQRLLTKAVKNLTEAQLIQAAALKSAATTKAKAKAVAKAKAKAKAKAAAAAVVDAHPPAPAEVPGALPPAPAGVPDDEM